MGYAQSTGTHNNNPDAVVLTEKRDATQWITINRPERRNAINLEVVSLIHQYLLEAQQDHSIRAIVLTGIGDKAFCAGADLNPNTEGRAFGVDFSNPTHYIINLFKAIEDCRLPIIARINGAAMAGGFGLLCACDMAIAADDVKFGTPESKVGVVPMMILTYMLRLVPRRKLMEMSITGEPFDAATALDMGIINYAVPRDQLDTKLNEFIGTITNKSPTAIRLFKQAFHAMQDMELRQAFEYAQVMVPNMASTQDAMEGMMAFAEKRSPNWTGQ